MISSKISAKRLVFIGGAKVSESNNRYFASSFIGKVLEELCQFYDEIILLVPLAEAKSSIYDLELNEKVRVVALPTTGTVVSNILKRKAVANLYKEVLNENDDVIIRGLFTPATASLYRHMRKLKLKSIQWVVGNPIALIDSHKRSKVISDKAYRLYAMFWERELTYSHEKNGDLSYLLCNGMEISRRFPSINNRAIISSTLVSDDYFYRIDTCQKDQINISCLCYMRPEKGIEYLVSAMDYLKVQKGYSLVLNLYGDFQKYEEYRRKIEQLIIKSQVKVVIHGAVKPSEVKQVLRESDIFVLPTLSEGTPRVILEAQASCVPVISTTVGGIPDMVENRVDGILVPSGSAHELAIAIDELIHDRRLRKLIISNAFKKAKNHSLKGMVGEFRKQLSKDD